MLAYQLRLGWISARRTPVLTALTVGGIALGIAVSAAFVTAHHLVAKDPLPHKSDRLFYVGLDSWDPSRPWDDDHPELPPNQVTWRDALALVDSEVPTAAAASFRALLFAQPERGGERPFEVDTRMTTGGFFSLFEVPFAAGGPWSRAADANGDAVVVLSAELAEKLFGESDAVGREVRLSERTFTVVGVLAPWRTATKFYDVHNGAREPPEEAYAPLRLAPSMELQTNGNRSNWGGLQDGYAALLASEAVWLQLWVELEDDDAKAAFQAEVDAYTDSQKALGRFQRPRNNRLQPLMAWLREEGAVPPESRRLVVISLLFLAVCAVNLVGLLLAKFLARAPEVAVRRALGASRRSIFVQLLVECQLVALTGGVLGLVASELLLRVLGRLAEAEAAFHLDLPMVGVGVGLAVVAGMIAGVYPAWRISTVPPAVYLKIG